ncbi:MAG: heme-binding protein [Stellaceae bacterium]
MPVARLTASIAAVLLAISAWAAPPLAADPGGGGCDTCTLVNEKTLSLDLARGIAQAALAKCRADGNHVSVTVLDRDGLVKIAFRDDGAGPHTLFTSRRKAFTALTFKQPSGQWAHRVLSEPAVAGLKDTAGTIALAGGMPVRAGSEVVGAIGVSGSPGGDKDEACANAGIAQFADKLK